MYVAHESIKIKDANRNSYRYILQSCGVIGWYYFQTLFCYTIATHTKQIINHFL
jgi:hypothetical protein